NSLIVVVTIAGLQLGGLISGAVVTEQIFALPGFGKLTLDAVFQRDYPVIQAVVVLTTVGYVVVNLAVDVLYSVIDPRIRVAGRSRRPSSPGCAPARRSPVPCCSASSCSRGCSPRCWPRTGPPRCTSTPRSRCRAPSATRSAPTTWAATCCPG